MTKAKVAITLNRELVTRLDHTVSSQGYPSRSRMIEEAVEEKLERLNRSRLARECAKLDPSFEQKLADEGLSEDLDAWPEY